ncbi:FecR domain-containing protein [Candidatus Saccharibacteria bacterium]|nr:FecR domain-containing protein [Candidatus Saccharibacteria bacterium]NIW80575.1 hypothetical protein [Calditrichia bacterium]
MNSMLISKAKKLDKALRSEKPPRINPEEQDLYDIGKKLSHTRLVKSDDIQVDAFFSQTLKEKLYYDWAREKRNTAKPKTNLTFKYATGFAFAVASLILIVYFSLLYLNGNDTPSRIAGDNDAGTPIVNNIVQPINAQLTYTSGRVEVWDHDKWVTAPNALIVSHDRQLRTGSEGRAILEFGDGSSLRLGPGTHVIIEESDTENIIIQQIIGTSYSRVDKISPAQYTVRSLNTETVALGTAFTVEVENFEKIKIKVLESKVKIKLIDINKNIENEVAEGNEAIIDIHKPVAESTSVAEIVQADLQNDFFVWNREEDRKANQPLGKLEDIAPPYLEITNPANGSITRDDQIQIIGRTEAEAIIYVNDSQVLNDNGRFENHVNLRKGENIVEIKSVDQIGNTAYAAILINRDEVTKVATAYNQEKTDNAGVLDKTNNETEIIVEESKNESEKIHLISVPKEKGTYLQWNTDKIDTTYGFMIMLSKTGEPTFPADSYYYFPYSYGRHYFQTLDEPGTYYLRICQYKKDQTCGILSNTVKIIKE